MFSKLSSEFGNHYMYPQTFIGRLELLSCLPLHDEFNVFVMTQVNTAIPGAP